MVGMAVDHEVGAVTVHYLSQAGSAKERKDFCRFSLHGSCDGRVMQHHDPFLGAQLRHGALKFQGFVDGCTNEGFDLGLSKGGENAAAEAANKSLGSGKAHAVPLVSASVQNLDSFGSHHAHELGFATAFEVVITKHGNDGDAQPNQCI